MNKLDKLKELNKIIQEMCTDLETRIFIEDMDINDERIIEDYKTDSIERK